MPRLLTRLLVSCAFCAAAAVQAQEVIHEDEYLDAQRPEAWAMRHFTSATTMTAFGPPPDLAPGDARVALELGSLPHLDGRQRRVGFTGSKAEDLNKSPAFGRARLWIGLPGRLVAEFGYTPPLEIGGARTRDLMAAALSRRVFERNGYALSVRMSGQHGAVTGDITCPAALAGITDASRNPYGCEAPSRDRLELNAYGADATFGRTAPGWQWHATLGMLRMEPEVQVDSLTFGFRDRSRLVSRGNQGYVALGVGHEGARWGLRAEVLYVPLRVQRAAAEPVETDALLSLRVQVSRVLRR